MSKLRLQRRGMDFYNACPEKQASDFDNFRYYGSIDDEHGGWFDIELTIHYRDNVKRVSAFLTFSHTYYDGSCFQDGHNIVEPYQAVVLEAINRKYNKSFDEIEFY